jgi:hypothetical protein
MGFVVRNCSWRRILFLLLLGAVCASRLSLLDRPLDRDEGEYAYAGQLMLAGIPPYKLAYNMKLPGTYAAYAAIFSVFGESVQAAHLGLLVANLATIVLLALIGRRLFGGTGGVCVGVVYAVLSCMPNVLGLTANASHFVMLAAVAGFWLLLQARESRNWLLAASGFCMGTAFVMKQPGAAFVGFGFLYLIAKRARWAAICIYTAAATAPFAGTCLLLSRAHVFDKFWFWTVSYGSQYGSLITPGMGLLKLLGMLPQVVGPALLLWGMAAAGLMTGPRPTKFLLGGWLLASAAAVSAGLYFRSHYFVMLLPALALLCGVAVTNWTNQGRPRFAIVALTVACALPVICDADYFRRLTPQRAAATSFGANPFLEAIPLALYLREHSSPDARIAVLGSEPEIYFYSQRHSATGYIYTYGLMEAQPYARQMQDEMIREIETARPAYVVYVTSPLSWLRVDESDAHIFTWAKRYLDEGYQLIPLPEMGGKLSLYRRRDGSVEPSRVSVLQQRAEVAGLLGQMR